MSPFSTQARSTNISIGETLNRAKKQLKTAGCETIDAEVLLSHCSKKNRAFFISHASSSLSEKTQHSFNQLLNQRLQGQPIAYLVNKKEFWSLEYFVDSNTLIPRPETETLIEQILEKIPAEKPSQILELGTGSGIIAITIGLNNPQTQLLATDISESALAVAKYNKKKLNANNVEFVKGNWFEPIAKNKRFDIIVSNPPYLAGDDNHLNQGDLRFEPISALVAEDNGLRDLKIIISTGRYFLKKEGWLILEHGYNQDQKILELFQSNGFANVKQIKDLAGILRVTIGQK